MNHQQFCKALVTGINQAVPNKLNLGLSLITRQTKRLELGPLVRFGLERDARMPNDPICRGRAEATVTVKDKKATIGID